MNRKFVLLVFVLLAGAVFLSACQSEVGGRVNRNVVDQQVVDVSKGDKLLEIKITCYCGDDPVDSCVGSLGQGDDGSIYADCSCCEGVLEAN